ncbi:uncharacterized protein LOC113848919 isoform X1 [Abrus precatorius]|uniref:tRNA (guanine(46)-N(7))-methyltransferase n=1 Tax=Abrus precatorius TaxID=3816 RepID=A0A8B8JRH7_ABRPR|nr:uncharacterized protein LOC113848919 isoform X1 [Abrus precatorius]
MAMPCSRFLRLSPFLAIPLPSPSLSFSSNCHVSSSPQLTVHDDHQQPHLRSSQLVTLEYADLNLSYNLDLGHVRIRQHVNPLSSSFSVPAQVPEWNQVFADPTLPLMVDIGCGSGRFLMWLAKRSHKERNFLGLEIRQRIVKRAELWVKDLALDNIHFLFANATISFKQLVESYPGPLVLVSILCPDPHFKKRHHKRRVLQKPLVGAIVDNLMPGGQVFVQSDVLDVALDMRNQFDEVDSLKHTDALNLDMLCDNEGWLLSNPMGIRTEREIHAELEGAKIYRRLYQKQK